MIDKLLPVLTIVTALGSGLMAGLFFAFSVAIMAALDRLPPAQGIAAMQSVNSIILNPLFGLVFGGTAVTSLALAAVAPFRWSESGTPWMLAGSLLYLVGCIVVTMAFNVPRNEALAALDPGAATSAAEWARYVSSWTAWNHVRTVACLAALLCLIVAARD